MHDIVVFIMPFGGGLFAQGTTKSSGGAERQMYLFGEVLSKHGYNVKFFVKRSPISTDVQDSSNVFSLPMRHLGGNILWFPVDVVQLLIRLIRLRPRWVVVKNAPQFTLPVLLARMFGVRLIMWGQTSTSFDRAVQGEPLPWRLIRHLAIRKARFCICQTQNQAHRLKMGFKRDGIVIRNITMAHGLMSEPPSNFIVAQPYILWVGNATANKRVDVVIELAKIMKEHTFVVVMNPGDESIWAMVANASVELSNLVFLGTMQNNEIDACFAGCQILVHTAIREGFPNVFLQAWQYGKPVVSINIDPDGVLRQYSLGACAFMDDSHLAKTPIELARVLRGHIESLLSSNPYSWSVRCREHVAQYHSAEVCAGKLIEVLGGKS